MVNSDTPPYLFEPKGEQATPAMVEPVPSEIDWGKLNTPTFIRNAKQGAMRKTPDDLR